MPEAAVLTPLHLIYLAGVVSILAVIIMRLDTPIVCIGFLFLTGVVGLHSLTGGVQTVFRGILYAAKEFMEVIATIALVTALSKTMSELGSDKILMKPMEKVMKTPAVTWWILGLTMFLFSLFLWPSPSVALVGAIMVPFALKTGLSPLLAAMALNLFGHGFALSYDAVIQGACAISASSAGISAKDILTQGRPVFLVMGTVTVLAAFFLNRAKLRSRIPISGETKLENTALPEQKKPKAAFFLAVAVPLVFLFDIIFMFVLHVSGGDATSLVSGTAVLLMCAGSIWGFGLRASMEKVTSYVTEGFLFSIKIFAPVIVIGAFFFLGGDGISEIMGKEFNRGILNDWALWLAGHGPLNPYMAAGLQMVIGALTGLDGSGFSGLPLTGALAQTFGAATGASVSILAALGQLSAIFVGGGTLVPWGMIPVAAVCHVDPMELARKNLLPVCIGFGVTFLTACLLLH